MERLTCNWMLKTFAKTENDTTNASLLGINK